MSARRETVVLTEPIHEAGVRQLREETEVVLLPDTSNPTLHRSLADADAVIVRLRPITADDMAVAPRLRVIGRHGAGVDNIDLPAATRRGIPVAYVPGVNASSVAEHTVALMLALAKHLTPHDQDVRMGRFDRRLDRRGIELEGKTVGVIGLGAVGRLVAGKCAALGMRVLAYDPYLPAEVLPKFERAASLDAVLAEADVITLHIPLTTETRGLIGKRALLMLKPAALIINTSRGAVIDEVALADALGVGRVGGAALDVFSQEPVPPGHPLLSAPNTLFTPHVASHTEEALRAMALVVVEQVLAVLHGRRPVHVANPEVYETQRR